ncbi:MAG: enoyl-CoA hydratase/isomerase family protein [Sphingomonadales bacterium]|nr:enoyl-CoA hydratase/isomerase family protein [Sphingomonadales bacterium]
MDIAALTMDAARLWAGEAAIDAPLAFIDLDRTHDVPGELRLPACPVIGVGAKDHPLADHLDAVVEPPVSAESIARQVLDHPRTAAVFVALMRLLPSLTAEQGLAAESLAYAALQGSAEHVRWRAEQPVVQAAAPGRVLVVRDGPCLHVTIERPEAGNAIDVAVRDQLAEAFELAALDPSITAVSLRGAGRTFSLGADLAEFGTTPDPATAHFIRAQTLPAHALARCADKLDVHVKGGCVGSGLEMAAWARHLTASPDAWFHLPELAMGVIPGAGGCVSLLRRIGRHRTALLVLSGKRLSARAASDWWLVDAIVDEVTADDGGAHVIG